MTLIKNYLYNAIYQIFILIVPFITMTYISRVIGPKGNGINAYTNTIVQYFVLFGSVGVSMYGNRQIAYVRNNQLKASEVFFEILIMRFVTISLALLAFYVFIFFNNTYKSAYIMQSILIVASAFDISWFFAGVENFKVTVVRNTLIKIISLFCIFIFVKKPSDLDIYIFIIAFSQLVGNLSLFPYLKNYLIYIQLSRLHIWRHFVPSINLFIPQVATQVYLILNKNMLGQMVSVTAAGFYDYSDKIVKMILAVVTATGTVMLPRVANTFAKGNTKKVNDYLYLSFDFVTAISIPMAFGLAAIALKFVPLFLTFKFEEVANLIIIESLVIVLIAWSNAIGIQYLLATNQNKQFTISVTIGAFVNVILNIPLIIFYRTEGAMIATVISELSVTLYQLFIVRNQISLKKLFDSLWKYFLSGLIMFAIVFLLDHSLKNNWLMLILEVIIGVIVYILFIIGLKTNIVDNLIRLKSRRNI